MYTKALQSVEEGIDAGETRYSAKQDVLNINGVDWTDNFSSIKDQLNKHSAEINAMNPVAVVTYNPKSTTRLADRIMQEVPRIGGGLINRNGISFEFDSAGAESIANHARTDELRAAALSAPYVAKYGKLIAGQQNHENTGLTTLTYAAPVVINETPTNVGLVIQFQNNGRPRAVNVELQNGDVFRLNKEKAPEGLDSRVDRYGQGTALPTTDALHNYDTTSPQNVNRDNSTVPALPTAEERASGAKSGQTADQSAAQTQQGTQKTACSRSS